MPEAATNPAKAKFAIKTALSLTLAYMLPMALGWPQPQTAATTVMLIAATGMVSESLQKGVLRILGTVLGAVIGLTLIALFPQDRMLYLLAVSVVVALMLYLYNAYQGDSTVFMLAAVVVMMVFNGGDADGAFLYGVDRTLLTTFGVVVYTVVASLLWPIRVHDNTQSLAAAVSMAQGEAFSQLTSPGAPNPDALTDLLKKNEQFQSQFVSVRNEAEKIVSFQAEWDTIASCFEQLDELLVPALQTGTLEKSAYTKHILNYDTVLENIEAMFSEIHANWNKGADHRQLAFMALDYSAANLQDESHLNVAAIVSRADLMVKLQKVLLQLWGATNSLLFDRSGFIAVEEFRGKPSFIWLDRENFKTAIRAFVSFWIAVAIWIQFNPPGGFMFVTLSTALVVLVSYTPVSPKLLYILFTLGFLFAIPAYVFLLPQMTHWIELAAFLFTYAFIGFYVFAGPISIFFLLGLMTLGIQNTMSYNFNVILILILLFYMVCTSLVIAVYFPFTSKPQRLYISFRRRFFHTCQKMITQGSSHGHYGKSKLLAIRLTTATALTAKMQQWGAMIDSSYYPANPAEKISNFNLACTVLLEQLKILARQDLVFSKNPLIALARTTSNRQMLSSLCNSLASPIPDTEIANTFDEVAGEMDSIESRLSEFLGENYLKTYDRKHLTEFYLYINLQVSILAGIVQCRESMQALDWDQLQGKKF